jgi:hypothetical protein
MMMSFAALGTFEGGGGGGGGGSASYPPLLGSLEQEPQEEPPADTKQSTAFPIPEPGTAFLLTLGLLGFTGFAYKKFKKVR